MAKKKTRRKANPDATPTAEVATSQQPELVEHVNRAPCSLEIDRNAKGQLRWALKLYGEREDMDGIVDQAMALDQRIREKEEARNGRTE